MLWETYSWDLQVLIISECFAPRKGKISWAPLVSLWEGNQCGTTAASFGAEIRLLNSSRNNSYLIRTKIYLQTNTENPAPLHQPKLCLPSCFPWRATSRSVCSAESLPEQLSATADFSSNQAHIHSAVLTTWCCNYQCRLLHKSIHIIKVIGWHKFVVSKKGTCTVHLMYF